MTTVETQAIIDRVLKIYLNQAKSLNQSDRRNMLQTWEETFREHSYEEINKALDGYLKHGKPYMPMPPDIISELQFMSEYEDSLLFIELEKAADMAANPREHNVIDSYGGVRQDPTSPTGWRYEIAEARMTSSYSHAEFNNLSEEIKVYATDISGLRALDREIKSNRHYARRRFMDRIPGIKRQIQHERS